MDIKILKNLEFLQILTSKHEILNYTTLTTVYDEIYIKNSYFYRDLALQIPFEFEPLYADILATVTYLDYELVVNTPYQSGKKCKSYIVTKVWGLFFCIFEHKLLIATIGLLNIPMFSPVSKNVKQKVFIILNCIISIPFIIALTRK